MFAYASCMFMINNKCFCMRTWNSVVAVMEDILLKQRYTTGSTRESTGKWVWHTWNWVSNPVLPVSLSFCFRFVMAPTSPEAGIWVSPQVRDSRTASWIKAYCSWLGHYRGDGLRFIRKSWCKVTRTWSTSFCYKQRKINMATFEVAWI